MYHHSPLSQLISDVWLSYICLLIISTMFTLSLFGLSNTQTIYFGGATAEWCVVELDQLQEISEWLRKIENAHDHKT